jgi:hypothetical protein
MHAPSSNLGHSCGSTLLVAIATAVMLLAPAADSLGPLARGAALANQQVAIVDNEAPASVTNIGDGVASVVLGAPPASERARPRADTVDDSVPPPGTKELDDDEDVTPFAASYPTSSKLLEYHSGPVQTAPRIYLLFWGPNWFTSGDPYGVANRLHDFYTGLGGSAYASALEEFGGKNGSFTNAVGQYQGWLQDMHRVPRHPSKAAVVRVAKRAAREVNDFSYNAQFIIATPWWVRDAYSTRHNAGAWHSWTYAGPANDWITFTSLPYAPFEDHGRGICGGNSVNVGTEGILDGVTINAGHEYAETVNDPSLHTWYDVDRDEIADKCSWTNLANRVLANGLTFPVQPYWSNFNRTLYGNGCLYGK